MSSEYERPERDDDATACAYTSYDNDEDVEYDEKESVDGEVPATGRGAEGVERRVWQALYEVEDPEMPISIVDLGLIYGVSVEDGVAAVDMTLTYTGCPARDMLINEVKQSVSAVEGVDTAEIAVVWSPGWTVDMVTEQGKESLREFGLSV
ncbi:1,2-phenylacetyl-CoA epoxidase subunit PaaD [Natrinema hispanicum]|uniref:Phenylacetate-CoA oxygenase, PaaJ subunit n=1 Tax=Natrinema hispanicum TaxID=392421 RepID=A0A1I0IDT8_9EURY|nr:1,2-phenylacetyl-CoA epoxidase subunit PaaD [Natrinema hispanicum]SET94919.1 phenylacetate-CoA oxygenase, PaaJ subunit [Natrinema hispanicum]